jgi:hypothetical protein
MDINDFFYRFSIEDAGYSIWIIGAYIGICIDVLFLGGTPQNINQTNSKLKAFYRFLIV